MRTLTPARPLRHPDRDPWFTSSCFRTFHLHPLNNAPGRQCFATTPSLAPDSPLGLSAVLRTSHIVSSLISRIQPYRVRVVGPIGPISLRTIHSLPVALHVKPRGDAVTFGYWRLAPPERDFHPPALTAPKRTNAGFPTRVSRMPLTESEMKAGLNVVTPSGQWPGQLHGVYMPP